MFNDNGILKGEGPSESELYGYNMHLLATSLATLYWLLKAYDYNLGHF